MAWEVLPSSRPLASAAPRGSAGGDCLCAASTSSRSPRRGAPRVDARCGGGRGWAATAGWVLAGIAGATALAAAGAALRARRRGRAPRAGQGAGSGRQGKRAAKGQVVVARGADAGAEAGDEASQLEACPGCGLRPPDLRKHMKVCCPEKLPESQREPDEVRDSARMDASGGVDGWYISEEEVKAAAAASVEAMEDPLLKQVLHLRFGFDQQGERRTPAEVAEVLGGKWKGKPEAALNLIRKALKSIPLVADDPKDIQVLFEDDELLAVAKPAFLRTTPVHRFVGKSLTNLIIGYHKQRVATGSGAASGDAPLLLHRLDQTTSGVVLCAKTKKAAHFLQQRWHGLDCRKEYLALARPAAQGPLRAVGDTLLVDVPIGRDEDNDDPVVRAVNHASGQSAATRLTLLAVGEGAVLLSCALEEAGRTHQIRVHAAHAGLPLLGDEMYGGDASADSALPPGRVALHAWRLRVPHPQTGDPLTIEAPPAADIQRCMDAHGIRW